MSLVISDKTLQSVDMSEVELKQELAILFFRREKFTLAQAARFANMTRLQFQKSLASRKIPVHYYIEDLEHDLKTLERLNYL